MTQDLLAKKYDLRVPRYTSYPTAPHFHPRIDGRRYREWLAALAPGTPLSLYFHVPYCDTLCWFCGCYTKIVRRHQPVADYLASALVEIDLVASALPGRFTARHLHWGGGSPTLLTADEWRRMTDRIRGRFDFAPDAELAVEMDPRETTEEYVVALAEAGVNRVSIGVQDFEPEVQRAINRIQPFEVTARVIDWLRGHGIEAINMDLMYGLPFQTVARVRRMVELALSLRPNRIALFGYAHVPWMKTHQKLIDEAALPDADERWRQAEAAATQLVEAGYVRIGMDHFARPDDGLAKALAGGRLHRNFQGYTTDDSPALIGFGPSAIGALPQGYVQNTQRMKAYREAIAAGVFPIERGIALSDDDRLRGAVIESLMCNLAADLPALCQAHGKPADGLSAELANLAPLIEDGLMRVENGRIVVTEPGRPFVRLVAAAFDTYLSGGVARHSRAV